MKIATWNCGGAFRKKLAAIDALRAEIYVIQECEDPARYPKIFQSWATSQLWIGTSRNKGIGIFSRSEHDLELLPWKDDGLQLFLPCRVDESFNLVGVWTKHAGSPNFRYIGQLWKYLQLHKSSIASRPTILCGDLNSNKLWDEWDRWWNHSDVVRELSEIGMHSIYHRHTGEAQGEETKPTLFMYRNVGRPYHIDYAFAPPSLVDDTRQIFVGNPTDWLEYSDHVPIMFSVRR